MTVTIQPIDKVLIYATWNNRLLVFAEPDFPDTPLQVPGGTVDVGEDILAAAYREFAEETGLFYDDGMIHLETIDYDYPERGQTELHRRHCFHLQLRDATPETWDHYEMSPCDGAPRFCSGCSGSTERTRKTVSDSVWQKALVKSVSSWQCSCLVLVKFVAYS